MFAGAARLRRAVFLHVPPPAEKGFDFGSSASRVKVPRGRGGAVQCLYI